MLIAGGGPVGMTLAHVLAHYGIRSVLAERNETTTRHPKMDITNARSMELFRRLGVVDALLSAVTLAVAALPEEFPVVFTFFLGVGVVLLVGTDSGIPMKFHSQSTWNELDVWVNQFGVPAIDAIRAATYWPAVAMGVDKDYGTVTEGKYADIVAVHGDALKQVALLQRIDLVVKHGKRVK